MPMFTRFSRSVSIMFYSRGKKLFLKAKEFYEFPFEISQVVENIKYLVVLGKNSQVFFSLKSRNFREIQLKITKVGFHPFSSKILILLGFKLFLYNLSLDKIESDFALTGVSNLSFSAYSSPVNFFIKDFSVYIVYEDAIVETLCPVAPREFQITFKKLLDLKSRIDQSGGYWAKEWVKDLFTQVKSNIEQEEKLLSDKVIVNNPKFQGKTGIEKVEIDFINFSSVNSTVSDIFSTNLKIQDHVVEVFFTSYRNGVVQLFLQDLPMTPHFKGDKMDQVPKWIFLEQIFLFADENIDTFVNFIADPKYSTIVYAYHDYGVHRIDFSACKENIFVFYKNSDENIFSDSQTSVEWVMSTFDGKLDSVSDLKILSDFEYGYSYRVITESGNEFRDILPIRPVNKVVSPKKAAIQSVVQVKEPFKIPTFPKLGPSTFKSVGKYPEGISEKLLNDFTKEIVRLRDHLTQIFQAGVLLKTRLEYILQEQKNANHIISCAKNISFNQEFQERLNAIAKRQKKLDAKSSIILQILLDQTQPELNSAEKEWFSDLKRLAILIKKKISLAIDDVIFVI